MSDPEFKLPESLSSKKAAVGLVLGSGLGGFIDSLSDLTSVSYVDIPGLPMSRAPGHAGCLHHGRLSGVELLIAQGRVHLYEGWTAAEAAAPVRLFHELGVETVVLTNAAGIVNANFKPGRWMVLSDHLNLARQSPLSGSSTFIDQSEVYAGTLRELLRGEANELALPPLHLRS
ncbi:MAG: purine-nucleoside phosphorylase [Verrucomicrobiota bacterium]